MPPFRPIRRLGVSAALLIGLFALTPGAGGQPPAGRDRGTTQKGQVQAGAHLFRLEAGKLYRVKVEGKGFTPRVAVHPGGLSPLLGPTFQPGMPGGVFIGPGGQFGGPGGQFIGPAGPFGGAAQGNVFEGLVDPKETREYKVLVAPNTDANPGADPGDRPLGYELTVTPLVPVLDRQDRTDPTDPRYQNGQVNQGPYKEYPVQFKAGQVYIVTLDRDPAGPVYNPYLVLEGPGGDVVAQNYNGGGNLNARVVHRSKRGGEYRVIATGLGGSTGAYRVRVISTAADDGGKAAPAPGGDAPGKSK